MTTDTGITFQAAMGEICKGVLETVAERPGESDAKQSIRRQTAVYAVMSFMPRDPAEAMLAGQCVIFDHLLRDGARESLRGQPEQIRLRATPQIHASGKMFLAHLTAFKDMRGRQEKTLAFQLPRRDARETSEAAPSPDAPGPDAPGPDAVRTAATPDPKHAPAVAAGTPSDATTAASVNDAPEQHEHAAQPRETPPPPAARKPVAQQAAAPVQPVAPQTSPAAARPVPDTVQSGAARSGNEAVARSPLTPAAQTPTAAEIERALFLSLRERMSHPDQAQAAAPLARTVRVEEPV
jgi:hypothetical protein